VRRRPAPVVDDGEPPAELLAGPSIEVWAEPHLLARLDVDSTMAAEEAVMLSARRVWRDAVAAWAATQEDPLVARLSIPSRRPYWE